MDDAQLAQAIEDNAAELLMAMGAAGGGEQRDGDGVRWTIGGSPLDYHNAVVEASLSDLAADSVIAESLGLMAAHGVPGCWHVGPSMRPADLGDRLLKAGFVYGGSEPGMAVELANLVERRRPDQPELGGRVPADGLATVDELRITRAEDDHQPELGGRVPADDLATVDELRIARVEDDQAPDQPDLGGRTPADDSSTLDELRIRRVEDDEALAVWEATLGRGFGEGEKEARWVAEVYRREGYGDPWRHYLGWLDGEPVATTTIFLAAGVAGVYFVMTVPEARRRGIGAAITYAALRVGIRVRRTGIVGCWAIRVRRARVPRVLHDRSLRVVADQLS
jgi:GNAT superfamily N-acetyltransferase